MNDVGGAINLLESAQQAASKNVLINGLLDIWQRSTSVTVSAEAYGAQDRWANYAGTSATFAQETTTVPTGCRYSCKVTIGGSASSVQSSQVIETANAAPYAGKTMILSGYFQSSVTPTVNFVVYYSNSVDVALGGSWTAITATSGGSGTATSGSFARITGTYAIPSTAKSLKVLWYTGSIASTSILYWGGMQFEAASAATNLVRNASTIQGELAACQRYYYRVTGTGYAYFCNSASRATTVTDGTVALPVTMRTAPTLAFSAGNTFMNYEANVIVAGTAIAADSGTTNSVGISLTVASGLTAGRAANIRANNTTAYIEFSSEL
jgi:hypothetical protein